MSGDYSEKEIEASITPAMLRAGGSIVEAWDSEAGLGLPR